MTAWMILAATVGSVAVASLVLRRRGQVAGPAVLASFSLVTLVSLMLLPLAAVACLAQDLSGGDRAAVPVAVAAIGLAGGMVARAGFSVVGIRRSRRRIAGLARTAACDVSRDGVLVVPIEEPAAFLAGEVVVVSRRAVLTLPRRELDAVIAHEKAHAAGRHPALTLSATALRQGMLGFPPARHVELALREQLELLADDRAATELGDPHPVAAAIARLRPRPENPADDPVIERRLERLRSAHDPTPGADRIVWTATAALGTLSIVVTCAAVHDWWVMAGAGLCLVLGAWVLRLLVLLHRAGGRGRLAQPTVVTSEPSVSRGPAGEAKVPPEGPISRSSEARENIAIAIIATSPRS
jgi:Zn-dependent protease with chaperone function